MEIHSEVYLHAILVVDKYSWKLPRKKLFILFQYVRQSFEAHNSKVLAVNGNPDHVHILFKMHPEISLDELLKRIRLSSAWSVNNFLLPDKRFAWENNYYGFTISGEEIGKQREYIEHQEELHLSISTNEELNNLIKEYQLEYDGDYPEDLDEDAYN
ncbi:MAG: IS200/IS605 family transposase [Bacteroidales bacterium]